jgi:hypothetical protein
VAEKFGAAPPTDALPAFIPIELIKGVIGWFKFAYKDALPVIRWGSVGSSSLRVPNTTSGLAETEAPVEAWELPSLPRANRRNCEFHCASATANGRLTSKECGWAFPSFKG